jgi:hypothetical protein
MLLSKGLVYSHIAPKASTVNMAYIMKSLDVFMKHLRKKSPVLVEQGWFFHWDNALVHTLSHHLGLAHRPQCPGPLPTALFAGPGTWDFFLFLCVKDELVRINLDHSILKKVWEGVTRNITTDEFSTAFQRWYERCQKCIKIGDGYVENHKK